MTKFSDAFRSARSQLGAGKTFTWNGKQFSTNVKGESNRTPRASSPAPTRPTRTAPTSSPRPQGRPGTSTSSLTSMASAAIGRSERQSTGGRGSGQKAPARPSSPAPRRTGFVLIDEWRARRQKK